MDHDSRFRGTAPRADDVRRAVAEAAPELGLTLESEDGTGPRMVGALVPAAHSTTDVDETSMPAAEGDDDAAIREVVERWENVEHHQVLTVAADVTTDPYVAVTPDAIQTVDSAHLSRWVTSDEFAALKAKFAPAERRQVEITSFEIFYMGTRLATATYQTREQGAQGVYLTSSTAIVAKGDDGWRITVVGKHAEVE